MMNSKMMRLRVGESLRLVVAAQLWLMCGFVQAADCAAASRHVDVMVLYTTAACAFAAQAEECASPGPIEGTITAAVEETNTGFDNSDVALQICLVFAGRDASFVEGGTLSADLAQLETSAGVRAWRDQYDADVVVLITRPTSDYPSGAPCGLAPQMPSGGNADVAYAAVPVDCATGIYAFGHELGHLMGADHETELRYPADFNHGFVKLNVATPWRTVMAQDIAECGDASPETGCTRVLHWSNPDVDYDGEPTGKRNKANNSQTLMDNAATVANYR
jgi:hypothetical protein